MKKESKIILALREIYLLLKKIEENTRKTIKTRKPNYKEEFGQGSIFIFNQFNQVCVPPLVEAEKTKSIIQRCNTRWRENPKSEFWEKYFETVLQSPHLMGKNDRGWNATLYWLLGPINIEKVANGQYASNEKVSKY